MKNKNFITISELAKKLGISRIAVFKKVKKGQIKAVKVGRIYAIAIKDVAYLFGKELSEEQKHQIERAVNKTVKEYGETLRLLGQE